MTIRTAGRRRARRLAIGTTVGLVLAGMNGPWLYRFGSDKYHHYKINTAEYKAENGHWEVVDGSGTGELEGLRGYAEFSAKRDELSPTGWRARTSLTYWLQPFGAA